MIEESRLFVPIEEHEDVEANREDGSCTVENGEGHRYVVMMTGLIRKADSLLISSDSAAMPQIADPVHRLSTFVPTDGNVLHETDTEWTVRLQRNDVRFWPESAIVHKV